MTPEEKLDSWSTFIQILIAVILAIAMLVVHDTAKAYGTREPEMKEVCRGEFGIRRRPCTDEDTVIKYYN